MTIKQKLEAEAAKDRRLLPRRTLVLGMFAVALAIVAAPLARAQMVQSSAFVLVRFWDGTNLINAGDNANNALRVNVVAGGAGGGNADLRVKDGSAALQSVGVQTESASILHVPVRFQGTGANVVEPLNSAPAGTEYSIPVRNIPSGTQAVSGNVGQTGTWTVQPGNTANTTPWLVKAVPGTPCGTTVFSQALAAVPTVEAAVTATTTCVIEVSFFNTNATAQVVSFKDNAGSPIVAINALSVPGNSSVVLPLHGLQFSSGVRWVAGGTGVTGAVWGMQ
jgi:hypothetical protein